MWTAIVLVVLRLDRISPWQWIGIAVSLAGVAWFLLAAQSVQQSLAPGVALTPKDILLGNVLTLIAALLFAIYGIVNRPLGARFSPPELMCYTLIIGTIALAPLGIPAALQQDWSRVSWQVWLIIPYSVIFPIYLTDCASLVDMSPSAPSGAPSASLPRSGSRMVRSARGVRHGSYSVTSALRPSSAARFSV
jgi:drug/metabolite transporter (DMT)-like permease